MPTLLELIIRFYLQNLRKFMSSLAVLLTAMIAATWIGAIAILSIQNITAVSLKFLTFNSLQLPLGVLLAFSGAAGWLIGAIAPLLGRSQSVRRQRFREQNLEDFEDFDIT